MKDNHIEVWLNIHNKATFARRYPPLKIGDRVRVSIKPKGCVSSWSKEVYNITLIKDKQYLVNDNKRRVYNRHEVLKVEGVEGKYG